MSVSGTLSTKTLSSFLRSRDMHLAAGGWIFFVAENALLSENRTWLIDEFGDQRYHAMYGTLSTIATASIGYAFLRLKRQNPPKLSALVPKASPATLGASWVFLTVGLNLATQGLPKFQIPLALSDGNNGIQVRCPFDFKEPEREDGALHGLERVTRHPGLWSMGMFGIGHALLLPPAALPLKVWFTGPALVAWLGGAHTDSRFRRGMGGTLSPHQDAQTSNLPFAAMMTGQQGNILDSASKLMAELKPLNAALATAASTVWVVVQAKKFRSIR